MSKAFDGTATRNAGLGTGGEGGTAQVHRGGHGAAARGSIVERFSARVLLLLAVSMGVLLVALLLTPINR
jgi:hypothetical protein